MPDERRSLEQPKTPGGTVTGGKLPAPTIPPWFEKALVPILLVIAALLPFFFDIGRHVHPARARQALAYVVMALGLNIVVGFAGLLDLGYVAFFAIGAYTRRLVRLGLLRVRSATARASTSSSAASPPKLPGHPRQLPAHPGASR